MSDFRRFSTRIHGEVKGRENDGARALRFYHPFLDDCLRGIAPNDLVLIGAPTGLGKTDLALSVAATNAAQGKTVHYFALEAEPLELERRTKFSKLSRRVYETQHTLRHQLNYTDWRLGRCEHIVEAFNREVDEALAAQLSTLWTFYRGRDFSPDDMRRFVLDVSETTDLIVVDHLHYIDVDDRNDALGEAVKATRDVALEIGKPVILIAHLRKREMGSKRIVPSIDDFHGSSNITKICTQAITIERCHVVQPTKWFMSPTFFSVLKDRRGGAPPYVALSQFDKRTRGYSDRYTLGKLTKNGADWEPVPMPEKPEWARHHLELPS